MPISIHIEAERRFDQLKDFRRQVELIASAEVSTPAVVSLFIEERIQIVQNHLRDLLNRMVAEIISWNEDIQKITQTGIPFEKIIALYTAWERTMLEKPEELMDEIVTIHEVLEEWYGRILGIEVFFEERARERRRQQAKVQVARSISYSKSYENDQEKEERLIHNAGRRKLPHVSQATSAWSDHGWPSHSYEETGPPVQMCYRTAILRTEDTKSGDNSL